MFLFFFFPRYTVVHYHRCQDYLPDYLVRGMLDFRVNFLTFQAVERETLEALADAVKNCWARRDKESEDEKKYTWGEMVEANGRVFH